MERNERDLPVGGGFYKRLFARYYDAMQVNYESYIGPRKRGLFAEASGTVVEVGPGTGANLRYLPRGCRWIGVEPNPYMHPALRERAEQAGVRAEFRLGGAEGMDVEDGIADVAISTLVLCSVGDQARALEEIRRVLRPGGRFLFIEHVAGRSRAMRLVQWLMRPAWYAFGDGCRTDRDTGGAIRAASFRAVEIDEFRAPSPPLPPWVAPHIAGEAVR